MKKKTKGTKWSHFISVCFSGWTEIAFFCVFQFRKENYWLLSSTKLIDFFKNQIIRSLKTAFILYPKINNFKIDSICGNNSICKKFKSHINEIIQLSRMLMRLFFKENLCIEPFRKSNSHLKIQFKIASNDHIKKDTLIKKCHFKFP